ncbi:hypothetical protein EMCG_08611 [[Emmonsia] crescens]|uniref:Uncharacterized protein n=1 Tax=[Emmonsia] crescens TaxID=73230 RepID=A0A0G2I525_9EURO|nr:hypothetical protein EMCG_08611 [Emmonsia crescens UAMH 3008]
MSGGQLFFPPTRRLVISPDNAIAVRYFDGQSREAPDELFLLADYTTMYPNLLGDDLPSQPSSRLKTLMKPGMSSEYSDQTDLQQSAPMCLRKGLLFCHSYSSDIKADR